MSLSVITVKRKVLAGEEAGQEKWYGQVRVGTCVPFEKVCKQVAHHCTLTHADVAGVLKEVLTRAVDTLDDGNGVQLGRLGNFRLTAGSKGVENEEDFTLREMKVPRVRFSPGKILRDMIRDVQFRKEEVKEVIRKVPCDLPHAI